MIHFLFIHLFSIWLIVGGIILIPGIIWAGFDSPNGSFDESFGALIFLATLWPIVLPIAIFVGILYALFHFGTWCRKQLEKRKAHPIE
jgi:hypothetical protein